MLDEFDQSVLSHPCLILAHADAVYAAVVARAFRRLGWDVYTARSGPEARRLVRMLGAGVVILDAELPHESGWLTCDKLTAEQPLVKVVLVGEDAGPLNQKLAAFVGASALVGRQDGPAALLREVCGPAPAVAG